MDLIITIPPEFIDEFQVNKFEDSLERVLFDISAKSIYCGRYERETIAMLKEAMKGAKIYVAD